MESKFLFILMPMCISFLSGCSTPEKKYSLHIFNTNEKAGTVTTKDGKFYANDVISINVELNDGYVVGYWNDSTGERLGKETSFEYVMPDQDITLTLYYDYAEVKVTITEEMENNGGFYNFSDIKDCMQFGSYHTDNNIVVNNEFYAKWNTKLDLYGSTTSYIYYSFNGFYDENDIQYGTTFNEKLPREGLNLIAKFTPARYGMYVECNVKDAFPVSVVSSSYDTYRFSGVTENRNAYAYLFNSTYVSYVKLKFLSTNTTKYEFDYWLNLDTSQQITEEEINLGVYTSTHRYKLFLKEKV